MSKPIGYGRHGLVKLAGDVVLSGVKEYTEMEDDGYFPRFRGLDGKQITIVVVLTGDAKGSILAVHESEVTWTHEVTKGEVK